MSIKFYKAMTGEERDAINLFLTRNNTRGYGSLRGYIAYFAATQDGKMIAAAKFCPLHTPQAARFFAGQDWRNVYTLQRLAARYPPKNLLSKFLSWCLKQMGRDPRVHYIATYADPSTCNSDTGQPHTGAIYRATNAVYCGLTESGRVEGYILNGQRHSMRKGPKTLTMTDIPLSARILRGQAKHRYCWAVGLPLTRRRRLKALTTRMSRYQYIPAIQPRLLIKEVYRRAIANWYRWFGRKSEA
jgi:hypothetical protein